MKRNTFMTIVAVILLVYGLGFLLFPAQFMSLFGTTLEETGQWVGRYLGSALIGVSVVAWFARNAEQSVALRAILLGYFIWFVVGLVVAILDRIYGQGNALIWSTVAVSLFLAVGFGYYRFVETADS